MNNFSTEGKKNDQQPTTGRDNATFISNAQKGGARTQSNLIETPAITLPKGGGALKSIDEKFSVNNSNGTSSWSIPLPFTPGRNGFTPSLELIYNSGSGNSPFGIGWAGETPSIHRKTEKKLPEYKDEEEADTFVYSGAEDLVRELEDGSGAPISVTTNGTTVTRYRPRIESDFARIEKIEEGNNVWWKVTSKDNMVSVFGKSDDAKLFSPVPGEERKIFKWCLEYTYDNKGNIAQFVYKKENADNIEVACFERNRLQQLALFTNLYIKNIRYGNKTAFYEGDNLPDEFLFEMVFDYGEHDAEMPTTGVAKINGQDVSWPVRRDAFSDYRAGFEIRTYRLCRRALLFHHMEAELGMKDYLVRSLDFNYDEQFHLTYLESMVQTGYIWHTDGTLQSKKSLPPLQFMYNKPGFSREVKAVSRDDIANAPIGLDNHTYQWTDLYSEGISGILSEQDNSWFYKENMGNGTFSNARQVSTKPAAVGLSDGSLSIEELEADGKKYLVSRTPVLNGYFELAAEEWAPFFSFENYLNIDLKDPNLRHLDLDGDGIPDILISQEQQFVWHRSKGKAGYGDYSTTTKAYDEEKGPVVVFATEDEQMMIAVADMSGDGLHDIVVITNSSVCYYPNLGYGRFGAKVTMALNDRFDNSDHFNTKFLHLADIDGSGTTDIIYCGNDTVSVWFNQSGNRFSEPSEFFNPFPEIDRESVISFIDLLGNGTNCLVWSSPLPGHSSAPLRYIDMMDGQKPHLLVKYINNLGKEISVEYKSSTQYYLDDKKNGKPWITHLPFPVQCVSKVITEDRVSHTRFTREYFYHHGYYDAIEREYRGFAMVEERDSEVFDHFVKETQAGGMINTIEKDLFQPAILTRSWFHTGAFFNRENFFHALADEYYPNALIRSGRITDPAIIASLNKYRLPENNFGQGLTTDELIECCRALKGMPLRQEVYSEEGPAELQLHPYTVTQSNYDVQCLQHRHKEKYAVCYCRERENLAFQYERNPLDPRISHTINVEIDKFGNVRQMAAVVYGRQQADTALPTQADQEMQLKQHVTYSTYMFTGVIDTPNAYRLPVNWDLQTWELSTTIPANTFFTPAEILQRFDVATIRQYEDAVAINEKRKIEHHTTLYYLDDLSGPAQPGTTGSLGLPFENYLLAFTPSLISDIYGDKVNDSLLRTRGQYVTPGGDGNYWIRSGKTYFHPDLSANPFVKEVNPATPADVVFAKNNFFLPVVYEDNAGHLTKVFYDTHRLLLKRQIDAVDNELNVDLINYRTNVPCRLRDANDNITGIRFDELGMVTHTFVMGKQNEFLGDWMDPATVEVSANDQPGALLEYEFRYFDTNGILPNRTKITMREKHHFTGKIENGVPEVEPDTRTQVSYAYSDGSGHEVLKKVQAEPGLAPVRDANGKLVLDNLGQLQSADTTPAVRWVGNGRTIINNKGNAVKQYEPFFDSSFEYNDEKELAELGCTVVLYYDALDRVIRKENPNGTFTKVAFDAWMQKNWDENDTVLDDACQWYKNRINGDLGVAEQQAAQKAALHNDTPSLSYHDSLARPFLTVVHNKTQRSGEEVAEALYYTRNYFDIEGNTLRVTQIRNNAEQEIMLWRYDMLGNICKQHSSDAGDRWLLPDAMQRPLMLWNSRLQVFSYQYDAVRRPVTISVANDATEMIFEKKIYGESAADAKENNLRGRLMQHFDTGGLAVNELYDFKGNLLRTARRLSADYKTIPDWQTNPLLDNETFIHETGYDALNRPVQCKYPDNSLLTPFYNEAGFLNRLDAKIRGADAVTHFITNIDYNAKGQRERIAYGNATGDVITVTRYKYETETYRLKQLQTRNNSNTVLQDLNYTYDPAGNITRQFDNAQKTIFYGGQQVAAENNYIYDAMYQLVEASGREHIGQIGLNTRDNWSDSWAALSLQPGSPVQLRNYSQKYTYDELGNMLEMRHIAGPASWTRTYQYNTVNNQLVSTATGGQQYDYLYNEHGSMRTMPHLQPGSEIEWNFREEMQHIQLGGGGEAWYTYDAAGQRIRKVVEKDQQTEVRIYLGGLEIFRILEKSTGAKLLERETLHVMDDKQRIAMVDSRTVGDDGSPQQLIRFQYSDHLGTACLELDDQAGIISYEEYHPYGTTAYQATNASIQVPAKRFRYSGMERDEESGLNYHNARYYVPWLGRWMNGDPKGIEDHINLYCYTRNNPVGYSDKTGHERVKAFENNKSPRYALVVVDIATEHAYLYTSNAGKLSLSDTIDIRPGDAEGDPKEGYAKTKVGLFEVTEIHKDYSTEKFPTKSSDYWGLGTVTAPFGDFTLKMGPDADGQWMHGTNWAGRISLSTGWGSGSHGCIRTSNSNIDDIAENVHIGTPILRIYTAASGNPYKFKSKGATAFDPQTATLESTSAAELFGPSEAPSGGKSKKAAIKQLTSIGVTVKLPKAADPVKPEPKKTAKPHKKDDAPKKTPAKPSKPANHSSQGKGKGKQKKKNE